MKVSGTGQSNPAHVDQVLKSFPCLVNLEKVVGNYELFSILMGLIVLLSGVYNFGQIHKGEREREKERVKTSK